MNMMIFFNSRGMGGEDREGEKMKRKGSKKGCGGGDRKNGRKRSRRGWTTTVRTRKEIDCVQQRWREWRTSKSSDIYRVVIIK